MFYSMTFNFSVLALIIEDLPVFFPFELLATVSYQQAVITTCTCTRDVVLGLVSVLYYQKLCYEAIIAPTASYQSLRVYTMARNKD